MLTSYDVGRLLARLRKHRRLSLDSAAGLIGIMPESLARLEAGERVDQDGTPRPVRIRAGTVAQIARVYQLTTQEQAELIDATGYTFFKPGELTRDDGSGWDPSELLP